MTSRLLIAYDGSAAAEAAVATAGRLFPGAHGRLVTVVDEVPDAPRPLGRGPDAATAPRGHDALSRELLAAGGEVAARGVASARGAGLALEAHPTIPDGAGWQAIVAAADAIAADVIVCGSRGRGGLARSLLGSMSTSLVHHATRPVLVVPVGPAAIDGPALLAYDGSAAARAAIAAAGRLLRGRPAIVVHVWYSGIERTMTGRALAHAPAASCARSRPTTRGGSPTLPASWPTRGPRSPATRALKRPGRRSRRARARGGRSPTPPTTTTRR